MKFTSVAQAAALLAALPIALAGEDCKYLPGDAKWPTVAQWNALNVTVGGRLVATYPLGSPCHKPTYNAAKCAELQANWLNPQLHMESSSSVMAPFFANQTCDPWTSADKPCTLGNYVSYAVNATSDADVVQAINFVKKRNIRLVIRNTGHDYNGKSTGAGALGIWTHYLKSAKVVNYSDAHYKGKALTIGAGVQGFEATAAAAAAGLVVVGGECPTVGVAGGYSQGGGHSALSTSFGLGADQTLSMKVVTARGSVVTASRTQNADLYWALSGGGGGTYGVVTEMTVKAYPDTFVSGGSIVFMSADAADVNTFYAGIEKFHELLPAMVDAGSMVVYYFGAAFFQIAPATFYGKTVAEVKVALAPFMAALDELKIPYTASFSQSATYTEHYNKYFGPLPYGNINVGIAQYGGRLIGRNTIVNDREAFMKVARSITQDGVLFIGVGTDVSGKAAANQNAVLPSWRKTLIHATLTTDWSFTAPWADMIALQDKMTSVIMPQIEAVTPGMGAYMNEANFQQPNYQTEFFGENYSKLAAIKDKWDGDHIFYASKSVGSEYWTVANNGRMCKAPKKPGKPVKLPKSS